MPTDFRDVNPFLPHSTEDFRVAEGDPEVKDLVREYPLRRWLQWMLSLWGERLPVAADPEDQTAVKEEILSWCWWWTRLSLAEVYPATRLAFGELTPKALPLVYGIARAHMHAWLRHLDTLSPRTLYQALLLGRELADPWASAIRDARYAWGLPYQSVREVLRPGFNFPRPPNPHPTSESSYWGDLVAGAAEFAGMSWRTLEVTAQYWANRVYDAPQAGLEPRETLFDKGYLELWGAEGEKQTAGRLADLRNLMVTVPNDFYVVIGKRPPFPHSPTFTAEQFLPGVRDWMGRVGEYSIRAGAWRRDQRLGPQWAIAADDADIEEVWLQGLVLSGGMYTASASLPRLFGTAKREVIIHAPALTTTAEIIGAAYGANTGIRYVVRTDAAGRSWMQAVRSTSGGVANFVSAPFRAMRDWWRFRKGGRVEWDVLIRESEPGLAKIQHSILANEAATKAGIPGQVSNAISRVLETASSNAGRAAQQATGTVINLGNTGSGLPLAMPGAGAAGAVQGAVGTVQQLGNAAMTERGLRMLKLAGGAAAVTGTIPFSAFILEESSQSAGMAAYQASRSKNPDLVQEATRRLDAISRTAKGPAPWIPGYNLWVAFSEFFAAQHFSADVFRQTAGQVRNLNGVGKPEKKEPVHAEPTGPGKTPGGRPTVPPTPKAPTLAPTVLLPRRVEPISVTDRRQMEFIEAENRETLLLNEYADLFRNGSRLLWDDTDFVWSPRARGGKSAPEGGIQNTGAPLRVYLLADGRVVLRLPREHALFGPIKDRMRRLKARKAAVFLPGLSDETRSTGLWVIQPEAQGVLGEVLLNLNDVAIDQWTESERDVHRRATDTDVQGPDFEVPEEKRVE